MLANANQCGFGDEIGAITNRVTAMFDVLANLEKDSQEYNDVKYRITCGQAYQQEAIDKIKGIEAKTMPKSWYDYKTNKELHEEIDSEGNIKQHEDSDKVKIEKAYNRKIMVNKKPYFFIYNYDHVMSKYNKFYKEMEGSCLIKFGLEYKELLQQKELSDEQSKFIDDVIKLSPVFMNGSTMNKIAWHIEEEFKDIKIKLKNSEDFDSEILKTEIVVNNTIKNKLIEIYKAYKKETIEYAKNKREGLDTRSKQEVRMEFIEKYKIEALKVCSNIEELCNSLIDICYNDKGNKQFVWDLVGEQIIENLLNKNGRRYSYPVKCKTGNIEWKGLKFKMIKRQLDKNEELENLKEEEVDVRSNN